ncbi:MAG: carboxypeptidase regulatory-like domain-containing protein [Prevotella sp.]|nr:carboxypeptidase regulatory-like domain-containing protein [Prevotella sp.]
MKKINFVLTFLLAWLTGATAMADNVLMKNYLETFENEFAETRDSTFTPAEGWGRYAPGFEKDPGEYFHVRYKWVQPTRYFNIDGEYRPSVDIHDQAAYSYVTNRTEEDNDMIITPKITGASSFYVRSTSYSGYGSLDVYVMKEEGGKLVPDGEAILSLGEPTFDCYSAKKFDIPAVEGKHLGIKGNLVQIGYFWAAQASVPEVKKVSLKDLPTVDEWANADAEGNYTIAFDVTVKNSGTLDITGEEENMSVSVVDGAGNVLQTLPIPAMAAGEKKTLSFSYTLAYAQYPDPTTISLRINLDGTLTPLGTYKPSSFAPKIRVTAKNMEDEFANGSDVNFGKSRADVTRMFTIYNDGGSDLSVTDITLPAGYTVNHDFTNPLVVENHSFSNFEVTMPLADGVGVKEGTLVLNNEAGIDFSLNLKGEIVAETTAYAGFEDNKMPIGYSNEDNTWTVTTNKSGAYGWYAYNDKYCAQINSTDGEKKFITPRLTFAEGETLEFEAAHAYYGAEDKGLNVYYSADGSEWTLAKTIAADELSLDKKWGYYKFTRFSVSEIPAGTWYVAIGSESLSLDNVCGGTLCPDAHAWVVNGVNFPEKGSVNSNYTAKISLMNNNVVDEKGTTYDVTLYENDVEVAKAEGVDIASGATEDITVVYTPHHMGDVNLKLVASANDADYAVEKEATANILEEMALSDVQIGTATTNERNIAYPYDKHSKAEVLLPTSKLGELKAGSKIAKMVVRGVSIKESKHAAKVWIANTTDETLGETWTPASTDDMTLVFDDNFTIPKTYEDDQQKEKGDLMTIEFNAPFVYDGNGIRLVVQTDYIDDYNFNAYFEGDTKEKLCYIMHTDNEDSSTNEADWKYAKKEEQKTPVVHFYVANDPVVFSGKVTDKSGNAIAAADITLKSDNVEYYATTDDKGNYTANVVKADRAYNVEVEAAGYKNASEPMADIAAAQTTKLALADLTVAAGEKAFVMLPYAISAAELAASEAKFYELTEVADNKAVFCLAADVEAYKPYMMVANSDFAKDMSAYDEAIDLSNERAFAVGEANELGYLSRRFIPSVAGKLTYRLVDGKFTAIDSAAAAEDNSLRYAAPFEAILEVADQADEIEVVVKDVATGINEVNVDNADAKVYNIAGVRVSDKGVKGLKSGLYIKNGKKVVVK